MNKKIVEILINLGGMVGFFITFLTLEPLVNADKYSISNTILSIVFWVLYDIFYWHTLSHLDDKKKAKEHYYRCVKNMDEKFNLNWSYQKKFENLEKYIEDYFED